MNEEQDLYWYLMMLARTMMRRHRVIPTVQTNEEEDFFKRGFDLHPTFAETETKYWRTAAALVKAVSLQQVAHEMQSGRVKNQLEGSSSADIEDIIDDWCGTKPHWPPRPHTLDLISEIELIANTFVQGPMRDGLTKVATKLASRALEPEGIRTTAGKEPATVR